MKQFNRIPRGTIFQTGESISIAEHGVSVNTFCKLSATVAVPIVDNETFPHRQYIPHLNQRCTVLGHVND